MADIAVSNRARPTDVVNCKIDLRITRVWRMRSEPSRIHYVLTDENTKETRRLYEDEGSELYRMLNQALRF